MSIVTPAWPSQTLTPTLLKMPIADHQICKIAIIRTTLFSDKQISTFTGLDSLRLGKMWGIDVVLRKGHFKAGLMEIFFSDTLRKGSCSQNISSKYIRVNSRNALKIGWKN